MPPVIREEKRGLVVHKCIVAESQANYRPEGMPGMSPLICFYSSAFVTFSSVSLLPGSDYQLPRCRLHRP